MIPWLGTRPAFPPVEQALIEPNGLLAAGGSLTPAWLLEAYSHGVFPWFSDGEPILWWSPEPRLILKPDEVKVSRSLAKVLRKGRFEVRFDTSFAAVVSECAGPRGGVAGTWITREIHAAYCRMHELGYAHSVEAWQDDRLVGGLYGIALGRFFFGESMFSRVSDASKVALVHLCRYLEAHEFGVIDCQMTTPHLVSMGAHEVSRKCFKALLAEYQQGGDPPGRWPGVGLAEER